MIGVLGHGAALSGYTGPGTIWTNEMYFVMNHAPGAGSIAWPADQQSSALSLYQGGPPNRHWNNRINKYIDAFHLLSRPAKSIFLLLTCSSRRAISSAWRLRSRRLSSRALRSKIRFFRASTETKRSATSISLSRTKSWMNQMKWMN